MTLEPVAVPMPMFPLGSALVPNGVMQLRLFEPRYLALARDCTRGNGRFGVVLIERGSEVGGGDQRFAVGTVARIAESLELPDGQWVMAIVGERRLTVRTWLPDDPYPLALVEDRLDAPIDNADLPLLAEAEQIVRRALELGARLGATELPPDIALSEEPNKRSWDLCAIAPLGPLDRQRLLETDGVAARLRTLVTAASDVADLLAFRLRDG